MRFKKYFFLSSLLALVLFSGWFLYTLSEMVNGAALPSVPSLDALLANQPFAPNDESTSVQPSISLQSPDQALLQAPYPEPEAESQQSKSGPEDRPEDGIFSESDPVLPSYVDLREDLIEPDIWESQYDLWLAGKKNMDEKDSIISRADSERLMDASRDLEVSEELPPIEPGNPSENQQLEITFDSIDITDCCGNGANVPPDPELAVGPHHIVAAVNVAFEIYDKSGNVLVPSTTFPALWNGDEDCSRSVFDPNALYDEEADRFILGIDGIGEYYCLAVSQTSDPTAIWLRYKFQAGSADRIFDYPQAGIGREAIYMGANIFDEETETFAESRVWAFDKWAMYANEPAAMRSHAVVRPGDSSVEEDTPQPMNLHGFHQGTWPNSGPHYFLTETDFDGAHYSVYSWDNVFTDNEFTYVGTFNLNGASGVVAGHPINVPQAGGGELLANDWRLQDAEYRNGYIWTTQTIACNPGEGVVNCVRWAQIDPSAAAVVQAGVIASDDLHRIYGDIGANHCNDMAVGYSISAFDRYASTWIANRQASQAPGLISSEILLKDGEVPYTAFDSAPYRWGDYTGMTSDPNGRDFWYIGQFSKNTQDDYGRWGTYIGCFKPSSCNPPRSADQTDSAAVIDIDVDTTLLLPIVANIPSNGSQLSCGYPVD